MTSLQTQVADILAEVSQTVILPRWRNLARGEVNEKTGPRDLVTVADVEAEEAITKRLAGLLPSSIVVGEEAYHSTPAILHHITSHDGYVWIVDPIDGTWGFANGKPYFGSIVALVKNGQTVAGWIYHCVTGGVLMTELGAGAWFKGERLTMRGAQKELLLVSGIDHQGAELLLGLTGFRAERWLHSHPDALAGNIKIMHKSRPACHDYVRLLTAAPLFNEPWPDGTQAHFRVILENSKPWDDAAGALAIAESGGVVRTLAGAVYTPDVINQGILVTPDEATNDLLRPLFLRIRQDINLSII